MLTPTEELKIQLEAFLERRSKELEANDELLVTLRNKIENYLNPPLSEEEMYRRDYDSAYESLN